MADEYEEQARKILGGYKSLVPDVAAFGRECAANAYDQAVKDSCEAALTRYRQGGAIQSCLNAISKAAALRKK